METIKRHPIRGFLYGILFGLGLMMIVVGQGIAALGTWPPFIVFIAGVVIATLWSIFGPAKNKGTPPPGYGRDAKKKPEPAPQPEPVGAPEVVEAAEGVVEGQVAGPEGSPGQEPPPEV